MTIKLTRKGFLGAAGSGAILLLLQACGGGGDGGGNSGGLPPPGGGGCSSDGGAITGNHGHTLSIAASDLDSTTPKTYSIAGSAGHDHTITLSVAQLATLKGGTDVTVTSTVSAGHSHDVTVSCV